MAEAKRALPPEYSGRNPGRQELTNLLCLEGKRGNATAEGLWAVAFLASAQLPQERKEALGLLRHAAEQGSVPAMLNLGFLLQSGTLVPKDPPEACRWFGRAADTGDAESLFQLAQCYHYALGTTQDFGKALALYQRAAASNSVMAMKGVGVMLMKGQGTERDPVMARHWLERAANEGRNRRAMFDLGELCWMVSTNPSSLKEAFKWFEQGATLGDPLACWAVAGYYERGDGGVTTNHEAFCRWRLLAAQRGATEAEYQMGVAYRTGDSVPQDSSLSLTWYRKAAAKNHPAALYDLAVYYWRDHDNPASKQLASGYMLRAAQMGHREAQLQCALACFQGQPAPPDCEAGRKWLAQSAQNGWAKAEYMLFMLFYKGSPPSPLCPAYARNVPEALNWLRRAADHGYTRAQSLLAVMLIRGTELKPDKAEAERLLRNAANHGDARAQNDLGYSIKEGNGSSSDMVEAAMWFDLAQRDKSDTNTLRIATLNLDAALKLLGSGQRALVKQKVDSFHPVPAFEQPPLLEGWEENPLYLVEDGRLVPGLNANKEKP